MRVKVALLLCLCVVGMSMMFVLSTRPPSERSVVQNFSRHRSDFEALRKMLREDTNVTTIADWGIQTAGSPVVSMPPNGGISVMRYQQYLKLLTAVHGERAGNENEPQPQICIGVWASGFAGDTRHLKVCNLARSPQNIAISLAAFYKSPKPRRPAYIPIEDKWYISADW